MRSEVAGVACGGQRRDQRVTRVLLTWGDAARTCLANRGPRRPSGVERMTGGAVAGHVVAVLAAQRHAERHQVQGLVAAGRELLVDLDGRQVSGRG